MYVCVCFYSNSGPLGLDYIFIGLLFSINSYILHHCDNSTSPHGDH